MSEAESTGGWEIESQVKPLLRKKLCSMSFSRLACSILTEPANVADKETEEQKVRSSGI